jgi:hypothetical protein
MFKIYVLNDFYSKTLEVVLAYDDKNFLKIPVKDVTEGRNLSREDAIGIINFFEVFMFENEGII